MAINMTAAQAAATVVEASGYKGQHCRMMTAHAVRILMDMAEQAAVNGTVSLDQLRKISGSLVIAETPLTPLYSRSESVCHTHFESAAVERKRTDHLGRLIVRNFSHLLDDKDTGIERRHLAQFFNAVRMILGEDEYQSLREQCQALANQHRGDDALIDWDGFYADPTAQLVLERILVSIARTFRRFDARREWFLILMNSSPAAVSVASNAFVARKPEDRAGQFGKHSMFHLFASLFECVRPTHFSPQGRTGFTERWGGDPEKVFGPLFIELTRMSAHLSH